MANATRPSGMSTGDEIRQLSKTINELEGVFRVHQQALRQKAMSLPQGVLPGLQQLHTDLDELAKSVDETVTEIGRLRALGDTAELTNSTLDLDDVLNAVMDTVNRLTGAERGYLVLRDPETKELQFRVARNIEQQNLDQGELIVSKTIVAEVAHTGLPIVTTNAQQDMTAVDSVVLFALRSIVCVPLIFKGEVTGVIYADNRIKAGLFGEKEMQLLSAFANQAAVAIENARLFKKLQASLAEITAMRDLMNNVFASIASGVITIDAADTIMILNAAACRILNVPLDLSVGKAVWQILPPLDEEFERLLLTVRERNPEVSIRDPVQTEPFEAEPEIAGRGIVNLSIKLSPLLASERKTQGVAMVVDDLTEIKQREAQLKVVQKYLPPQMVDKLKTIDELGLGGKRRLVTTLFVDVRNFNTFPPAEGPRELMKALNAYLTVAADAIAQQNGVIDKYMANEIMGLFNTQLNPDDDDHAWRAIQAAVNMVDQYLEFYRQNGEADNARYYRIGIHTGIATLGKAGSETRKEFTAIGDSINLAHRVMENALPGQIIISEATYKAAAKYLTDPQSGILVTTPTSILARGRTQLTQIYQIRREEVKASHAPDA